ncbi:MAG TPA: ATP-binding protein [Ktedonobacteraceae bacterium]|nr:ATP-binding protein [Ktedonobacteraceae bacterium]
MAQEEPQIINVQEAAEILGVSPTTIRRWAQERKIEGKQSRKSGEWLFTEEALQAIGSMTPSSNGLANREEVHLEKGQHKEQSLQLINASSYDFLAGGGEMGERIRTTDWSKTPLGPVETWPQSLRTIVRIMLTSRQPIWIGWGPELIKLYNDAYKTIVGGKHPWALGRPASEVWHEIWDSVGPRLQIALEQNEGTYDESLLLIMERYGYPEETYYTFSYSPVPGDHGGVEGIICANTDDTQRIIGERQVKLLRTLAAESSDARTIEDACRLSVRSLGFNTHDIPFAMLYLLDHDKQVATLVETAGIEKEHPAVPATVALDASSSWPFATAFSTQKDCLVSDLEKWFDDLPTGAWELSPHQAIALPIAPSGQAGKAGMLVVGLNPYRLFDEGYQGFLNLVAGQIAASLANAQAYEDERKRAEALAEIDRAKTLFFSNVSHELRTPLTLILGSIEETLANRDGLSLEQRERSEIQYRNSLRLLRLVNTLLDFSRIEAGKVQAFYKQTDLASLTADLASNFRSTVEKAGMQLIVDCPPLKSPVYVDQPMWEKIVLNLLSNAFKYTLEGKITVTLRQNRSTVELKVSDTGVGIPEEELPRMFERFHRVRGTEGRTHEGTGIGLSLVHELVKLHGGTIGVTSKLGKGSTFTVTLPLGITHLPEGQFSTDATLSSTSLGAQTYVEEALWLLAGQEATAQLLPDLALSTEGHQSLPQHENESVQKARILFADDNADMRAYVGRLLRQHYEVQTVPDGLAALAAIKQNHPDLVLTDVMMPKMDGFELLQKLRSDPETRTLPVILLSARAGEEAKSEGMEAGADDYLIKPFSVRELLARVGTHLQMARLRKEAEDEVKAERQRLRDLFMQAPAYIAVLRGPDHIFELANPLYMKVVGAHREIVGKSLRDALPELVGQGFAQLLDRVYQTGEPFTVNESLAQLDRNGNGTLEDVYFNFVYQPSRDARGNVDGVLVYAVDVTEQVKTRQLIQESEARFRTLADNIPNLAWMAQPDGWIYWYNSRWYDYTGTRPEQMRGHGWQAVHHPDVLPEVLAYWSHSLKTGEPFEMVFPLRGADGNYRPFLTRTVAIRDETGKIVQWFGTNTDITKQKQLEQQKDEFIGIASHELKTPVTSIKGYTQLLERHFRKAGDQRSSDLLKKMDVQINKLTNLIGDLLDSTRIESGKLLFHLSSFDYNDLVSEVVEDIQRTTVKHTIAPQLAPSVTIYADRDRIGQVLTNLFTNAIKYSPNAKDILVRTEIKDGNIITSIQDFGIGIPKEKQPYVFERFFRVEGETQITYPGLGLGLYISSEFVKRHQGSIWVESKEDEGTTISFSLPLEQGPVERNS